MDDTERSALREAYELLRSIARRPRENGDDPTDDLRAIEPDAAGSVGQELGTATEADSDGG